ncbi:PREDICTED: uncharacterized protein LOC107327918 [Acropora digitifera]|uniref:uncharacterized protein LOC107327918 n=1 Tax=Acropora digitifera TaxID=70779 RepID=UPI00077A06BF|nr:PREDICTED: uncharacterized protein LOC107327918 [Acropora digitifera]
MEALEDLIKYMRRWLEEVGKLGSEVTQELLARLATSERVLRHTIPQNPTDTHNAIYQMVCESFIKDVVLSACTALISKAVHHMSQEKSDLPKILQPKVGEIMSYLEDVEGKYNEINPLLNEIKENLEKRNYELTEKEKSYVNRLLMKVETTWQQVKIYVEVAEKALVSLSFDVDSYRREQGVSGWNVFLSVIAGAAVGALGVALYPVVEPAAAVFGGGIAAGVGSILHQREVNHALLFRASLGLAVSGLFLCLQLKEWYATRTFCNRLSSIIQNYSDKVDEMKRLLNSRRV